MTRRRLSWSQVQAIQVRLDALDMAPSAEAEHEHLRAIVQICSSVLPSPAAEDDVKLRALAERLGYRLELL